MDDRTLRGMIGIALAVAMLVVGAMAGRIFPVETAYVLPLFVFASAIFLADGAVTLTRMHRKQAELDRERDRVAAPWRVAFAVSFLLALIAASRTGASYVTTSAVILAVAAATIYLYRRRFFAILLETGSGAAGERAARMRQALRNQDLAGTAHALEEWLEQEKDPSRRSDLLLQIGLLYVLRGMYDEAIRALERIDRGSRQGGVDMAMVVDITVASAFVAKGDFESAERVMARLAETTIPAEFRTAYDMNRSAILVGKGAHADSIRFVDALPLATMPESSRLPFLRDLAESLAASGSDTGRALEVAGQCLAIDGGAQSQNVMAFVLLAQKKLEEAAGRLVEALKLNPDGKTNLRVFAETWYYLGLVKRAAGDAAAAAEAFRKAAEVRGGGRFSIAALREIGDAGAPA